MFKLILLDYCMPEMDGLETAKKIRELIATKGITQPHICCASAYTEPSFVKKALESGMDSYISKPVNLSEILALMQKANINFEWRGINLLETE